MKSKCKNCGKKIKLWTHQYDYMGRLEEMVKPVWMHLTAPPTRRCELEAEPDDEE